MLVARYTVYPQAPNVSEPQLTPTAETTLAKEMDAAEAGDKKALQLSIVSQVGAYHDNKTEHSPAPPG